MEDGIVPVGFAPRPLQEDTSASPNMVDSKPTQNKDKIPSILWGIAVFLCALIYAISSIAYQNLYIEIIFAILLIFSAVELVLHQRTKQAKPVKSSYKVIG